MAALLVRPEAPKQFPNEDSVSICRDTHCAHYVCVYGGGQSTLSMLCMHLPEVFKLSFTCQPGCISPHPGAHRGCNTAQVESLSLQSRAPETSRSPLLNAFWLHLIHPPAHRVSPSPPVSGRWHCVPTAAAAEPGSRPRGGTRTDTLLSPPPALGERGAVHLPGITQIPLPPSCPALHCQRAAA